MHRHPLFLLALLNLVACTSGDDRAPSDDPSAYGGDDPTSAGGDGAITGNGTDAAGPAADAAPRLDLGTDSATATSTDGKIHIRSDNAPLLVVYRDGPTAPWQAATKLTPNHYQATVHGPYMVGVVCDPWNEVAPPPLHLHTFVTWEAARTLDDPRDLTPPCDNQRPYNGTTGQATASSLVQLGELAVNADTTGRYIAYAPLGARDLIASTARKLLIQRNVLIDYGYQPDNPTVDVAGQGKALIATLLGLPNIVSGETVQAQVHVATATTNTPAAIYVSPPATFDWMAVNTAPIKVVPDAVLDEPGDTQTVTATATLGASVRSLARAFHLYGDTDFVLPQPLSGGVFAYDTASRQVSARWTALPETTALHLVIAGATTDPASYVRQELHATAAYLDAVNPTSAKVDLALPGFQDAWRIDFHQPYTRTLAAQHITGDDVATSAITETTSVP